MQRRHFITTLTAAIAAILPTRAAGVPKHRILLRSSWQTVNIGDIGHTPGALRLFETHLPDVEITLWPSKLDRGVREQLMARFPKLLIVEGEVDDDLQPTTPALKEAFAKCDLLVHGSAPNVMVWRHLDAWRKIGKPYGFFGITFDPFGGGRNGDFEGGTLDELKARLAKLPLDYVKVAERSTFTEASFIFLRDTLTMGYLRQQFPNLRHTAFGPDATFACDLRDDAKAEAWLKANNLEEKKFICVIPRLRWTPYHMMDGTATTKADRSKVAVNERTRAADHAGLREMIIRWVRETGMKAAVCPEMTYQVQLGKEELIDPLPEDVKPHVVWRETYWLNDEASSVYRKAFALVSLENHSPILALAQGTPMIFIRQPTDTIKGQMWRDLEVGDWFLEVGDATGDELWNRLAAIHADPSKAAEKARAIHQRALDLGRTMVEVTSRHLKS